MSKRTNVNPDHYKVDGRLRPDESVNKEEFKRSLAELKRPAARRGASKPKAAKRRGGR
jgi:hypothetical protein